MTNIKEQEELFLLIGENLNEKLEVFVIGGSAMLYYKAKEVTKDIDVVCNDKKQRDLLADVLFKLGFTKRSAKILYFEKKNVPLLLQRGDDRFDIFYDKIIDFKLTDSIKERITASYEYSNLIVNVISGEDIILLKCATERAGDRADAAEIIKRTNINWSVILDESVQQMKIIGDIIPLCLYDFMCELKEDLKTDIPQEVIDKVGDVAEIHLAEKLKSGKTIRTVDFKHTK